MLIFANFDAMALSKPSSCVVTSIFSCSSRKVLTSTQRSSVRRWQLRLKLKSWSDKARWWSLFCLKIYWIVNENLVVHSIKLTFTKICAGIRASEEISVVFITKVEDQNLLGNVHLIFSSLLIGLISNRTTFSAPGFNRVTSPLAHCWLTWSQAILNVTLEDDSVALCESESFIDWLKCVTVWREGWEDAGVNWATEKEFNLLRICI